MTRDAQARDALRLYKSGGDRIELLYSLRDAKVPDAVMDSFFEARDGSGPIVLPTLVGEPLDAVDTASALMDNEGDTSAFMLVLDEELVIFIAHDTMDDNHPTLVLRCPRNNIELAAIEEAEEEEESDEEGDEPKGKWVRIDSYVLPTEASSIGGGTGFPHERLAGYLSSFEPDAQGLWHGEQIVAASQTVNSDMYSPSENVCLDPPVFKERFSHGGKKLWCHETVDPSTPFKSYFSAQCDYEVYVKDVSVLPLEAMVKERPGEGPSERIYDKITEKEMEAASFFRELILVLYKSIPLDDLPPVGHLRRVKERYPIILLRELVQRGRATVKRAEVRKSPKLGFIFANSTPADIFSTSRRLCVSYEPPQYLVKPYSCRDLALRATRGVRRVLALSTAVRKRKRRATALFLYLTRSPQCQGERGSAGRRPDCGMGQLLFFRSSHRPSSARWRGLLFIFKAHQIPFGSYTLSIRMPTARPSRKVFTAIMFSLPRASYVLGRDATGHRPSERGVSLNRCHQLASATHSQPFASSFGRMASSSAVCHDSSYIGPYTCMFRPHTAVALPVVLMPKRPSYRYTYTPRGVYSASSSSSTSSSSAPIGLIPRKTKLQRLLLGSHLRLLLLHATRKSSRCQSYGAWCWARRPPSARLPASASAMVACGCRRLSTSRTTRLSSSPRTFAEQSASGTPANVEA